MKRGRYKPLAARNGSKPHEPEKVVLDRCYLDLDSARRDGACYEYDGREYCTVCGIRSRRRRLKAQRVQPWQDVVLVCPVGHNVRVLLRRGPV